MSYKRIIANMAMSEIEVYIDGRSLNSLVPGYRTEKVEGRNNFNKTIRELRTNTMNGAVSQGSTFDTKNITVTYGLVGDSDLDLHNSEDQLRYYLSGNDMKISFADEPNVYYICTCSSNSSEEKDASGSGFKFSSGSFTLHRSDPYKYSVQTRKISPDENFVFQFTNYGTVLSYPTITVSISGIGSLSSFKISNKDEKSITIGTKGVEIKPFIEGESSFNSNSMYDVILDGGKASTPDSQYTIDSDGGYSFSNNNSYVNDYNSGYAAPEWNVVLDVESAGISVENLERDDLDHLKNQWEEFAVHPGGNYLKFDLIEGTNIIGVTITYREIFL